MAHLVARRVAVIAAGEMGAAVASRLVEGGHTVLTNLEGRSESTRQRAKNAGMQDVPFDDLARDAEWMLSILPPRDALSLAKKYANAANGLTEGARKVYVDCNAVSPETAKRIGELFEGTDITFLDAGIIGGPPSDTYASHIYASAEPGHDVAQKALNDFLDFSKCGIKITPLKGDGAGIGAASALKMSYAGITKGTLGLFCTMILAAHNSSPSTSSALLQELNYSQPQLLQRIARGVPSTVPKAYRWVAEMEEISSFVNGDRGEGEGEGDIHHGMAKIFQRMDDALQSDGRDKGDIKTLLDFAGKAKEVLGKQ